MLEKLVLINRSNNSGLIDVKMDGCNLEEKLSFKMLELSFSSKLDWGSIVSIATTASKYTEALIRSINLLFPEVRLYLYKFAIRPCMKCCCHVLLVTTSICQIGYRNSHGELLVHHLLPLLSSWIIVDGQPA